MASKKLINSINSVVDESLSGLCVAYPQLDYHPTKRVVLSSNVSVTNHLKQTILMLYLSYV